METPSILHHPCSPIFKPPRIHLPHSPQNPNLRISSLKPHNTPKPLFSSNLHSPLFSITPIIQNPRRPFSPVLNSLNPKITHVHTYPQIKTLSDLKNKLLSQISKATPYVICKWVFIISLLIAVTTNTTKVLLNPFFWMYFSWTWLFWPWFLAIFLGIFGVFSAIKHMKGEASVFEQMVVITSCFTWLTLVPPAQFNGFLEGWPVVFFFVYHYFFFFNVTVRNRLYGDLYPRPHDEKWDIDVPAGFRVLFFTAVMVGHWLAAFEAPPLHQIPGGWINLVIWVGIMLVLFMQYHSVLYLSKYSEKIKVPMSVVQFGPYRWVRHPIYASTMFLFGVYFAALRAPLSLLFILAVCVLYYEQKTRLEEDLMVETFGEEYTTYCDKDIYSTMPRGRDIAWEHMTSVDGSTSRVRCNYCHHEMSGGATRMKEHLLGRRGEVVPCLRIPRAIQDHIRSEMGDKFKVKASAKARTSTEAHDDDAKARTSTQAHDDDRELEIVLQLSRQEAELQKRQAALEEEEMELAIQRSLQDPWRYGQGSSSRFSGGPIIRDPPSSSSRYQPYPYQTHSDSDSST